MRRRSSLLVLAALAACARPPRNLAGDFPRTTVADAQQASYAGARVRWGGTIASTNPGRDETCIEVVSRPLDRRAHPRDTDVTYGRFRACAPGFYDPQVYGPDREVTVVGTIEGTQPGKVGEYDYPFPRVAIEEIYLWPKPPPYERVYYPDPLWYPWWGWGWGWYGGGTVIYRAPPPPPPRPMVHHKR
jgi:outer membrane lipoprotein